jgi:hypothetical protein
MSSSNLLPFSPLAINLLLSLGIFYMAYHWLLKPALPHTKPLYVLTPILLLHALRHLGVMFVSPGVASPDIPWQFAWPAAAGDFIAATLAMVAAALLHRRSTLAIPALWIFNIFGSLDFASSIILSRVFQASNFLGSAYWIPVFWVPMLIVGHVIVFNVLGHLQRGTLSLHTASARSV